MKPRQKQASRAGALLFTCLALVFTAITAWLLSMMFSQTQYTQEPLREVVVVSRTLEPLQQITSRDLSTVKLPLSTIPAGSFTKPEELLTTPPKRTLVAIHRGEIILTHRLADETSGWGLSPKIPNGMRAAAVRVDNALTITNLLYPGAMVDVIATLRLTRPNTTATQIFLQGIRILAVNRDVDPSQMAKSSEKGEAGLSSAEVVVALLVSPEEAEFLALAAENGRVFLTLRNQQDEQYVETDGVIPEDLYPSIVAAHMEEDDSRQAQENRLERSSATRRRRIQPQSSGRAPVAPSPEPTIRIR